MPHIQSVQGLPGCPDINRKLIFFFTIFSGKDTEGEIGTGDRSLDVFPIDTHQNGFKPHEVTMFQIGTSECPVPLFALAIMNEVRIN
jgi:hypothetical protein